MILQNLKQGSCETTFRLLWSSFDKNYDWTARKNRINLWEPYFSFVFKLFSEFFNLSGKIIKNRSDIFWEFISFDDLFIRLCENDSGGSLNIKFNKCFGTLACFKTIIYYLIIGSKYIDRIGKVT